MVKIDGILLRQMIISGANNLYNHYPEVDGLNVFPVPDGDTGTNMNLTVSSGVQVMAEVSSSDIYEVARTFARGAYFGSRGNSGVILSQIFRGFAEGLKGKSEADAVDLAEAFLKGSEVAYSAVEQPVEGTLLTVEREAAQALYDRSEPDMPIDQAIDIFLDEAKASLERTPNLLPILKEVGVVDSGGAGFVRLVEGFSEALHNRIVERDMASVVTPVRPVQVPEPHDNVQAHLEHEDFGYCTEFLIQLSADPEKEGKTPFDDDAFRRDLNGYGNSIVALRDEDKVKVHIHSMKPGDVLNYGQQYGEFLRLKIESMTQQHQHLVDEAKEATTKAEEPLKEYGMVAVCSGAGLSSLFRDEIGVDRIVSGGQTMNPSTADLAQAIRDCHARNVFVFPDNSNIVMAAETAAQSVAEEGIRAVVIPAKTIPEGLVAAGMFNPTETVENNTSEMTEALSNVASGEVTYAVRSTSVDGVKVKEGQFMGLHGKAISNVSDDRDTCLFGLLDSMVSEESSIIMVICGEDVSAEDRERIESELNKRYGQSCEIDVRDGGQQVYSFIVSVE